MRSTEFEARPRLSFPRVLGGASYTSPHLRLLCILHSSFCPPSRPPPVAVRSTLKHFFPIKRRFFHSAALSEFLSFGGPPSQCASLEDQYHNIVVKSRNFLTVA